MYDTLAQTRNSTDMPFLSFSASASPSAFLRIRRLDCFSVSLGGGTDDSNQTMTGTGSVNGMLLLRDAGLMLEHIDTIHSAVAISKITICPDAYPKHIRLPQIEEHSKLRY